MFYNETNVKKEKEKNSLQFTNSPPPGPPDPRYHGGSTELPKSHGFIMTERPCRRGGGGGGGASCGGVAGDGDWSSSRDRRLRWGCRGRDVDGGGDGGGGGGAGAGAGCRGGPPVNIETIL